MRLKSEMHAIIGMCAAAAFVVTGVIAWFEVRRVHRVEVRAQGETMGLFLARACALAMRGPNPRDDLEAVLTIRGGDQEPPVVSAAVYDARQEQVLLRVGSTPREVGLAELRTALEVLEAGRVLVADGAEAGREGPRGEELVEFTVPIVDGPERVGVLHLALRAAPASVWATTFTIMLGAAVMVGALWLMLYKMINGRILRPILSLTQAIMRVRAGDVSARVEIQRRDELGTLAESFNELIGILIERDSLQQRLEEANRLAEAHRRLNDAHRQLKEAQEQLILNEKHASLGRLVHGLNHELNNPLSAAKNMVPPLEAAIALLRERLGPPPADEADDGGEVVDAQAPAPAPAEVTESLDDAAEAAQVIARSVQRAINIVRDLGQFSKLGTADLEEVALAAVVQEAVAACAQELGPGQRVIVQVDVPEVEGGPLKLKAFPNLLTQVFVNLLTNSAQAIDGPGKVKVAARLLPGKDRVRIEVEDTGPGIPKEHLSKVFEPFFTTKEPGRGTGLGLAICLGVVEKHGGTIEALKRRRGACFAIELPREAQVRPSDPRQSASLFSGSTITLAPAP
ncbi:MAG: HAMP domain-containing histidine kinase [Planctomycetes bacterium]|nr:HAMP domain-containing histidine kinase [Planctomycetota bacterium]